jgi:trehalose-6-phosphate synthase
MGAKIVIASNRSALDFKKKDLARKEPIKFGDGGLVQAMAGLLKKKNEWQTIWYGASMGDADEDVVNRCYDDLFEEMLKSGIAPENFPFVKIDDDKRIHFEYKDYDFLMKKIFFDSTQMKRYYTNFSIGFLWPVLHLIRKAFFKDKKDFFPKPFFTLGDMIHYRSNSVVFADAIFEETIKSRDVWRKGEDFIVWLQDFHLIPTSTFYREELDDRGLSGEKNIHVGQFMHTPFFNIDIISDLLEDDKKMRREEKKVYAPFSKSMEDVLKELTYGMLGNDFIGFHLDSYCENFVEALKYFNPFIGVIREKDYYVIEHNLPNKRTVVGAHPIGVDVENIVSEVELDKKLCFKKPDIDLERLIREDKKKGTIVFGGLERLDYTKGIPERIEIFQYLLEALREEKKEGRFIQIAARSRQDNIFYKELGHIVKDKVDVTNRKFGRKNYLPVVYRPEGIEFPQNYRFMRDVDVLMVTPKEDGMNLVVFEGILSKKFLPRDQRGFIVVGNCGAAEVLRSNGFGEKDGIIYINPSHPKRAANKILRALKEVERGYGISDRVINFVENNCRIDEWAKKNITSIKNTHA